MFSSGAGVHPTKVSTRLDLHDEQSGKTTT